MTGLAAFTRTTAREFCTCWRQFMSEFGRCRLQWSEYIWSEWWG